jgi:hypothetical protein
MNAPILPQSILGQSILDGAGVDPVAAQALLGSALHGADDGEIFLERSQRGLRVRRRPVEVGFL